MLRGVLAAICLALSSTAAAAMCGERGCRLPSGKCAGWAQAEYCRAHPEAAEAPAAGLATGTADQRKPKAASCSSRFLPAQDNPSTDGTPVRHPVVGIGVTSVGWVCPTPCQ